MQRYIKPDGEMTGKLIGPEKQYLDKGWRVATSEDIAARARKPRRGAAHTAPVSPPAVVAAEAKPDAEQEANSAKDTFTIACQRCGKEFEASSKDDKFDAECAAYEKQLAEVKKA